jgi:hypothetical protein
MLHCRYNAYLVENLCVPVAAEENRGLKLPRTSGLSKFNNDCELTGTINRNLD